MVTRNSQDLLDFVAEVAGDENLKVEENLGQGFYRLRVAEAERRQAKHDIRQVEDIVIEMLRNSRDAAAKHIFIATSRSADSRRIIMADDGCGIPSHMQAEIFDARVTSKLETMHMDLWGVHGRGMALYSIKENTELAQVMASWPEAGTSIKVVADVNRLPEKYDQSTWPKAEVNRRKLNIVKGPHNIIRTCCEFALEEADEVQVYLGTIPEIVQTIRNLYVSSELKQDSIFCQLGQATEAQSLEEAANNLGFELSQRNAYRILDGSVEPQETVLHTLKARLTQRSRNQVDLVKDRRGLKFSDDAREKLSRSFQRVFDDFAQSYYLELNAEPEIKVSGDIMTVTFDFKKID